MTLLRALCSDHRKRCGGVHVIECNAMRLSCSMLCADDDASEQIHTCRDGAQGYISITACPLYPLQCFHVAFYHTDLHSIVINTDIIYTSHGIAHPKYAVVMKYAQNVCL